MIKWVLLVLFVSILIGSGWWARSKNRTPGDFFLGGRKVGPWMTAFAYGTTYFSAVLFVGYAGKVGWGFGLSALWVALGNALLGSWLAWKVLARPTRQMTERLGVMTMPEFFRARYQSPLMKVLASSLIFVFLVPYSASVYMGLSYLFEQIFGLPYALVAWLMAAVTAVFLILGGYLAVAVTDFIQGIVMLGGVGVMTWYILHAPQVGGLATGISRLAEKGSQLVSFFPQGPGLEQLLALVLLTSFGTWGMPQMVQKFCAIRDEKVVYTATRITTLFALLISGAAYGIGAFSRLFFDQIPLDPVTGKPSADLIMPLILKQALPEWAAAVILLLVLSASMSTLSSLVLVASSALTMDVIHSWLAPGLTPRRVLQLLRLFSLVFVGFSLYIALQKPAIILTLMALSWGTVAGAFLGPYLWGLYSRRVNQTGALAGMVAGAAFSIIWAWYFQMDAKYIPLGGCLAMLTSILTVPVFSLVGQQLPADHLALVFGEEGGISQGEEGAMVDVG
ncbi:solute:Na+ symporter, SSS family [Carboxydocella sporoproducens DSM 16521]|uniref:Solute:Na+ symporter, SSS family n=2 Tax=Carboxydocella TaxID=178898 RepID=A0A1T4PK51_9FIRM|nr:MULTISPECIES: sodium/solute symporter [Carboxydocella]AVX19503.1 solute:Na+ symporter, SSS family [Carboxydocella thermautotrophica]SJZ91943.1 solute:Na+ symporter, SSS family [Carboxydocella sporoproducens DSM 16521]